MACEMYLYFGIVFIFVQIFYFGAGINMSKVSFDKLECEGSINANMYKAVKNIDSI